MALISVLIITYNHEKYIAEAIEGALLQQCSYSIEIVIGDDCSKDETTAICKKFAEKYPGKIKLLLNEHNIGMMPNFIKTFGACTGKYIAMCEGDDYWTDPLKLQKQVGFLEANPDYAICFHRVKEWFNGELHESKLNTSATEETLSINNLASGNFMHTPSVVFRNHLFTDFPGWFSKSFLGDYVLHMLNAQRGLIKYFPETMAVYRYHQGGTWSSIKAAERLEKGIWVVSSLQTCNFTQEVLDILLTQERRMTESYLKLLMRGDDWDLFIKKLAFHSEKDSYIAQKWLTEHYPKYIATLKASKAYKVAQYLQKGILKYKKKLTR